MRNDLVINIGCEDQGNNAQIEKVLGNHIKSYLGKDDCIFNCAEFMGREVLLINIERNSSYFKCNIILGD